MTGRRIFCITTLLLGALVPLCADEVQVGKMDRLSGTVLGLSAGRLHFSSDLLGETAIRWDAVTYLRTENNMAIATGNQVLVGIITGIEGGIATVQTAAGVQDLDVRRIDRIEKDLPPAQKPRPAVAYKGKVQFGFAYATGNTQRQEYLLGAELHRQGGRSETRWKGLGERGETAHVKDLARAKSEFSHSRGQSGRGFLQVDAVHEHDDVRQLELRSNYSLSMGYKVIERPTNRWHLLFGGNYLNERYKTSNSDEFTMRAGSLLEWVVFHGSRLKFTSSAYPSTKEIGHIRANGELSLSVPVTSTLDLTIGASDDFDSAPPGLVRKNDLRVRTTLGYNF